MEKCKFIPIGEVFKILKKPTVKNPLRVITSSGTGFHLITVNGNKFTLAPVKPCISCERADSYGVAIQNRNSKKLTLLICPECGAATIKPYKQFPFLKNGEMKEGKIKNASKNKKQELVLG